MTLNDRKLSVYTHIHAYAHAGTHTHTHTHNHPYPITDHEVSRNPYLDNVLYGVRNIYT